MKINNFKAFSGQHCETTTTGSLLLQLGIDLSEPMLFGLGEGLSYIFWNMKMMEFPFIGGRVKPDVLTENICRNLNLELTVLETSSKKKAWQNVEKYLQNNQAVGLKLDCYHLEYFTNKIHFAGHYVAMYGHDEENAFLVDTRQQGGEVKTSLKSLELARSEKGPMSSKNLVYTIQPSGEMTDLAQAVKKAITNNAKEYLNPPIKNISYKGIFKTSSEIKKWFARSEDRKRDFQTTAMLMENGGTGGAIFRNLYRDFLKEAYELLKINAIHEAHLDFVEIAQWWTKVADLFMKAGEYDDVSYIDEASEILKNISKGEFDAMSKLAAI